MVEEEEEVWLLLACCVTDVRPADAASSIAGEKAGGDELGNVSPPGLICDWCFIRCGRRVVIGVVDG